MTRSALDSRQVSFEGPFKGIVKGIFNSGKSRKTDGCAFEWPVHLGLANQAAQILF
jgi:hypothetical protein